VTSLFASFLASGRVCFPLFYCWGKAEPQSQHCCCPACNEYKKLPRTSLCLPLPLFHADPTNTSTSPFPSLFSLGNASHGGPSHSPCYLSPRQPWPKARQTSSLWIPQLPPQMLPPCSYQNCSQNAHGHIKCYALLSLHR
jgi:hypothetical protein